MKNINVKIKKLGSKRVKSIEYQLSDKIDTLKELLEDIARCEVDRFNRSKQIYFLSQSEIELKAESGKVDFSNSYNSKKALLDKALESIFMAFKDGLFMVFIDDKEIKDLDESIKLSSNSEIIFLRLTFLAGRHY